MNYARKPGHGGILLNADFRREKFASVATGVGLIDSALFGSEEFGVAESNRDAFDFVKR